MSAQPLNLLVRRLRRLANPTDGSGPADADLLDRFVRLADHGAFEALVRRHGGMVLGVCRRVLGHEADAEDAFQATFLVLARKAHTIGRREALAAWLYRVAHRAALEARAARARRAAREGPWVDTPAPPGEDPAWRDLRPVLDEEIGRLPDKYRAPFVLCHLEGKTNEEAAAALGCPHGTVLSRLSRARDRLRRRLAQRGVTAPAAGLALLLAAQARANAAAPGLVDLTTRAALSGAALPAAAGPAAALAEGVLQAMFLTKLKAAALASLAATALAAAVVFGCHVWQATTEAAGPQVRPAATAVPAPNAPPAEADPDAVPQQEDPRNRAARARISANNLKQIGLAMHNFEATYQSLPPPAIADARGRPLLSWRVTLLPFVEQDKLYRQFKLDEPWDSAHNLKLLAQMPALYAAAGRQKPATGLTYYQVFAGPGTAFERMRRGAADGGITPDAALPGGGLAAPGGGSTPGANLPGGGLAAPGGRGGAGIGAPPAPAALPLPGAGAAGQADQGPAGVRLADITDGTSNTIFVVEAGTPVPWTKPEDLPFPKFPGRLGGVFGGDCHALMGDGSVRFLGARTPLDLLNAAITRAGGEVIDWKSLPAPGGAAAGADLASGNPREIEKDNSRLKDELQRTLRDIEQTRAALERIKEDFNLKSEMEARQARLLQENRELALKLAEANRQLEALRAEVDQIKERLKDGLKK